jgi:glutathione peroxidase
MVVGIFCGEKFMKMLLKSLLAVFLAACANVYASGAHDFSFIGEDGETHSLAQYKGKILVVMNTATECGYRDQYKGMQKLIEKYGSDKLAVIGVSSNSFNSKEPRSNDEIRTFCTDRFGITYPIMDKVSIGSSDQHPFFAWTAEKGSKASWNFNKFLIDRDGNLVKRFSEKVKPSASFGSSVEKELKKLL